MPRTNWIFYPMKDSVGDGSKDMIRIEPSQVQAFVSSESMHPKIVAINTLGFIKSQIVFPLQTSPFFGAGDGLYVKAEIVLGED